MTFRNIIKSLRVLFVITLLNNFIGCNYSFTGSSVPPHLETIYIAPVKDRSGSGQPDLEEKFNNLLRQKFIDDNSLRISDKSEADATLDCTVSSFSDAPEVVQMQSENDVSSENVASRRIKLSVKVTYKDLVKKITIFDKAFSDYGDYTNEGDILQARSEAVEEALEKLTEDILLGVVSNW